MRTTLTGQYPAVVEALDSGNLWESGAWGDGAGNKGAGGEWSVQTGQLNLYPLACVFIASKMATARVDD